MECDAQTCSERPTEIGARSARTTTDRMEPERKALCTDITCKHLHERRHAGKPCRVIHVQVLCGEYVHHAASPHGVALVRPCRPLGRNMFSELVEERSVQTAQAIAHSIKTLHAADANSPTSISTDTSALADCAPFWLSMGDATASNSSSIGPVLAAEPYRQNG